MLVARELTDAAEDPYMIGVLNGGKRRKIGNAWYGGGARHAIDENIHRRSNMTALLSYLMNMGMVPDSRWSHTGNDSADVRPDALSKRIERMGGCVVKVTQPFNPPDVLRGLEAPPKLPRPFSQVWTRYKF